MKKRRCKNKNCRCLFEVSLLHPKQRYCTKKECQGVRKAIWEQEKLAKDKVYRENKADSQKRWMDKKPWYWKNYRKTHPEYTKRNREKQKQRDHQKRDLKADASILINLAKTDVANNENNIISGIYKIIPASYENLAKTDAIIVKIERLSTGYG